MLGMAWSEASNLRRAVGFVTLMGTACGVLAYCVWCIVRARRGKR